MPLPIETNDLPACVTMTLATAKALSAFNITIASALNAPIDFTLDGSNDGTNWTEIDFIAGEEWVELGSQTTRLFPVTSSAAYKYFRLRVTNTTSGILAIIGVGLFERFDSITRTATATSVISQEDADYQAGQKAQLLLDDDLEDHCRTLYTATADATGDCLATGETIIGSGVGASFDSQEEAQARATAEAAARLVALQATCSPNDNEQKLIIFQSSTAGRYPSAQTISDFVGAIGQVRLRLRNVSHYNAKWLNIILESPAGTVVEILRRTPTADGVIGSVDANNFPILPGVDVTFDDTAAGFLVPAPYPGDVTVKTTIFAGAAAYMPMPAPQPPWANTLLSAFNGENPNGVWKLWVNNMGAFDAIFFSGWEVLVDP